MSDKELDKLVKQVIAEYKPKLKIERPRDNAGKFISGRIKVSEETLKAELKKFNIKKEKDQ